MQRLGDYTQELKVRQTLRSAGRAFQLLLLARNNPADAAHFALTRRGRWPDADLLHRVLMAAVPGQTAVVDSSLIPITGLNVMSVVRQLSLVDRLPGVVRVPFDTAVTATLSAIGSAWVGGGRPVPISKMQFSRVGTLTRLKVAALTVLDERTREKRFGGRAVDGRKRFRPGLRAREGRRAGRRGRGRRRDSARLDRFRRAGVREHRHHGRGDRRRRPAA